MFLLEDFFFVVCFLGIFLFVCLVCYVGFFVVVWVWFWLSFIVCLFASTPLEHGYLYVDTGQHMIHVILIVFLYTGVPVQVLEAFSSLMAHISVLHVKCCSLIWYFTTLVYNWLPDFKVNEASKGLLAPKDKKLPFFVLSLLDQDKYAYDEGKLALIRYQIYFQASTRYALRI